MKTSKFNVVSQSKQDPTKFLVYNTFHDHRILFDDPALNPRIFFDKIHQGVALTPAEEGIVPELKEMGIILDDATDEQEQFVHWYQNKIRERKDIMQVTILPTMACNLACDYCFENDVRESGIMTMGTAEKVVSFLQRKVTRYTPKTLVLHFFGGEPLLNPKPILYISKKLSEFLKPLDIQFTVGMITNGVLLTPEFVDEMIPHGFKWVKITFDGDREEHNRKRIYHNRKGTFDIIYDNLCKIQGKLKIAIGGNFDNDNYESMFGLVDRLKQSPFSDDIMIARFKPIMKTNAEIASQRQGRVSSFCDVCSFNSAQINGIMALQEKLWEVGLPIQERPEMGPCEYHSRHSFTISPDGSLYKCPAFVGLHNMVAGDVDHDDFNAQGEWQIQHQKWDEDCEKCTYLPNCVGGCRYSALNLTGSLEVKSCDIEMLTRDTEEFMQRELEQLNQEA